MRTKKGTVTATKMTGTATVTVHHFDFHPVYKKRYRKSKKFLVDTGDHKVNVGDIVSITECRPLSKRKCFRISEILEKSAVVDDVTEEAGIGEVAATRAERKDARDAKDAEDAKEMGAENDTESDSSKPEDSSESSASSASSDSSSS